MRVMERHNKREIEQLSSYYFLELGNSYPQVCCRLLGKLEEHNIYVKQYITGQA